MTDELKDILKEMQASELIPEMIQLTREFIDVGLNSGGDDHGSIAIMFDSELVRMKRMIQSDEKE